MTVQQRIALLDDSHVGEARRTAASFSRIASLSEAEAGRVANVVTELGTNLRKHASGGELLMRELRYGQRAGVEVLSIDRGPGMDLATALRDGHSTAGTRARVRRVLRAGRERDRRSRLGRRTARGRRRIGRSVRAFSRRSDLRRRLGGAAVDGFHTAARRRRSRSWAHRRARRIDGGRGFRGDRSSARTGSGGPCASRSAATDPRCGSRGCRAGPDCADRPLFRGRQHRRRSRERRPEDAGAGLAQRHRRSRGEADPGVRGSVALERRPDLFTLPLAVSALGVLYRDFRRKGDDSTVVVIKEP